MTNSRSSGASEPLLNPSTDVSLYHEEYFPPFLPALLILPFLLPFFWRYRVTVSRDQVVFGYSSSWTRKSLDRSTIISAEPIQHINGLLHWGGWGIRMQLGTWATGYIARNGPGVRVKTKDKSYVFNCKDPQHVCAILFPALKND